MHYVNLGVPLTFFATGYFLDSSAYPVFGLMKILLMP